MKKVLSNYHLAHKLMAVSYLKVMPGFKLESYTRNGDRLYTWLGVYFLIRFTEDTFAPDVRPYLYVQLCMVLVSVFVQYDAFLVFIALVVFMHFFAKCYFIAKRINARLW